MLTVWRRMKDKSNIVADILTPTTADYTPLRAVIVVDEFTAQLARGDVVRFVEPDGPLPFFCIV